MLEEEAAALEEAAELEKKRLKEETTARLEKNGIPRKAQFARESSSNTSRKAVISTAVLENQESRDRSKRTKSTKQPVQEPQQHNLVENNDIETNNQDFDGAFQRIHSDIESLKNYDSASWEEHMTYKMDDSGATLATNVQDIEAFVNLSNLALDKCTVYDPHNHLSGLLVLFDGKRPTSDYLRGVAKSITSTFLRDLVHGYNFLLSPPKPEWTVPRDIIASNCSHVYMKCAYLPACIHIEILQDIILEKKEKPLTISRAKLLVSEMKVMDPNTLICVSYLGESDAVIKRWKKKYPNSMHLMMERAEKEQGGVSFYGVIAQFSSGTKFDCLSGESLILGLLQYQYGTDTLHRRMMNWNLIHGGPNLWEGNSHNGTSIVEFLKKYSRVYPDTPLSGIEFVPSEIKYMATIYVADICEYRCLDISHGKKISLKDFHCWFCKVAVDSSVATLKERNAEEIASFLGIEVSMVDNASIQDVARWRGSLGITKSYQHAKKKAAERGYDVTEYKVICTRTIIDEETAEERLCGSTITSYLTCCAKCPGCKNEAYVYSNDWAMENGDPKPTHDMMWYQCSNNPANCYRSLIGKSIFCCGKSYDAGFGHLQKVDTPQKLSWDEWVTIDDLVLGEYVNSKFDDATFNEIAQKLSVCRSTEQIKTRITDLYDKRFYGSWTVKQCLLLHCLISKHGNRWMSFEAYFPGIVGKSLMNLSKSKRYKNVVDDYNNLCISAEYSNVTNTLTTCKNDPDVMKMIFNLPEDSFGNTWSHLAMHIKDFIVQKNQEGGPTSKEITTEFNFMAEGNDKELSELIKLMATKEDGRWIISEPTDLIVTMKKGLKGRKKSLFFMKLLMKHLKEKDKGLHENAYVQLTKYCFLVGILPLNSVLSKIMRRLRDIVGEVYWNDTSDFFKHFYKRGL